MAADFSLRILTYNIHKGFGYTSRLTLADMREQLHEVGADVVFLQEIQEEHSGRSKKHQEWPIEGQLQYLARGFWPHYAYGKNAIYNAGHHGNALLSKYSFARWENIKLNRLPMFSRGLLHGVIYLTPIKKPLHVICFHLGLTQHMRNWHAHRLCEYIRGSIDPNEALIVAGDSNDFFQKLSHHFDEDLGLKEVHKHLHGFYARSFPSLFPMFALDRIYVRGLEPVESKTLGGRQWYFLSDHLPLYSKLKWTGD